MADSSVLLEVIVEGKNIKVVQRDVESLASSINNATNSQQKQSRASRDTAKAHDEQSRSARDLYRNQQGLAGNTSSGTKAFSKQVRGITDGLVPAYAALAANIFAVTALFGAFQRSASLTQLENSLIRTGEAAGQNLPKVADNLIRITDAAISTRDAYEATAMAFSAGFSTSQLERLTQVADGASKALGRDLTDSLTRLVRGTAKLEPEILDELGIMVRLDDATIQYAASMGKTADQLSRFERQQAFLNATLNQGEKKFGDLVNSVDANPFNQLAATFNDLSKTVLEFLVTIVTPFVEFLSNNKIALTGALVLLGSTISNQVVTPLKEAAAEAARLAAVAAVDARKAALEMGSAYTTQLKKVKDSIKTVPAGFDKFAPSIEAGTASAYTLQQAVTSLTRSEAVRERNLANYANDPIKKAQKEQEIQEVRTLREEIEKLIDTEKTRGTTSFKSIDARATSASEKGLATYLQKIDEGEGVVEKFQAAFAGMNKQWKIFTAASGIAVSELGLLHGGLAAVKAAWAGATASLKLFSAALVTSLPVIGEIIIVVSLLVDTLSFLWERSKLEENTDEIIKSFGRIEGAARNLTTVLQRIDLEDSDKAVASLKVRIGLVDQLTSSLVELGNTADDQVAEKLKHQVKALALATEELKKERATLINRGYSEQEVERMTKGLVAEVESAQDRIKLIRQNSVTEEKTAINDSIDAWMGRVAASELLSKTLEKEVAAVRNLQNEMNTGKFDGNLGELVTKLDEVQNPSKAAVDSITGFKTAIEEFGKETIKFSKKSSTPFSDMITQIESMSVELNSAFGIAEGKSLFNKKDLEDAQALIDDVVKLSGGALKTGSDIAQTYRRAVNYLKEQESIMVQAATASKELNSEAKKYAEIAKTNGAFTILQMKLQQNATDELIKGKKAELALTQTALASQRRSLEDQLAAAKENKLNAEGEEQLRAKIANLAKTEANISNELGALTSERIKDEDIIYQSTLATLTSQRELNALAVKSLAVADKKAQLAQDELKSRLQLQRAVSGSGLSAEDEYDLAVRSNQQKVDSEAERLRVQKEGIRLEYALLRAKSEFEKAKLTAIQADATSSADVKAAAATALAANKKLAGYIDAAEASAKGLADEESRVSLLVSGIEVSLAEQKKIRSEIAQTIEEQAFNEEKINTLSSEGVAISFASLAIQSRRAQLQSDLNAAQEAYAKDGKGALRIREITLDIEKSIFDETKAQLDNIEKIVSRSNQYRNNVVSTLSTTSRLNKEMADLANTNPFTGKPISLQAAIKINEQERQERLALAYAEAKIKKATIDAEFNMLKARFNLLKAELAKNGITTEEQALIDANQAIIDQQDSLNGLLKGNIDREFALVSKKIEVERMRAAILDKEQSEASGPMAGVANAISGMVGAFEMLKNPKPETEMEKTLKEVFDKTEVNTDELLSGILQKAVELPVSLGQILKTVMSDNNNTVGDKVSNAVSTALTNMAVNTLTAAVLNVGNNGTGSTTPPTTETPEAVTNTVAATTSPAPSSSVNMIETNVNDPTALQPGSFVDTAALNTAPSLPPAPAAPTEPTEGSATSADWVAGLATARTMAQGFANDLASLGPEGEAMSQFVQGGLALGESITATIANFEDAETKSGKAIAIMGGLSQAIGAVGQMAKAASDARVAAIDKEIAAEKARDGKSAASVAKIKELEAKKEREKRKAFETDKKMKMAQAAINTAMAITQALASAPPPISFILAGLAAAMGAAQMSMISSMTYQGGASSTPSVGASQTISVGSRKSGVDDYKSRSASGELAYFRGSSGQGGPESFKPAFTGAKYRAAGGPTTGYVVGEQGPELFVPETPGVIVPNQEMEASTAPAQNVNFTISAVDAAGVQELLVRQRGNIIGMIREAANSHGKPFMEGIETATYTQSAGGATKY